jgi:hypothetical protein
MITAIWPNTKSQMYSDIRIALKLKPEEGKPTPSKKEAKRTWREDFLGILSEEQKKEQKKLRQVKSKKNKNHNISEDNE